MLSNTLIYQLNVILLRRISRALILEQEVNHMLPGNHWHLLRYALLLLQHKLLLRLWCLITLVEILVFDHSKQVFHKSLIMSIDLLLVLLEIALKHVCCKNSQI